MKAINFLMTTSAAALFMIFACQKQDTGLSTSKQVGVAAQSANGNSSAKWGAAHVHWEIISLDFPTTTFSPGGEAFASAISGSTLTNLKIRFTGSGTFVEPASGETSSAVTGGGTWETFTGAISTGSGTYDVTKLASWEFASMQTGTFIDLTGNTNERANGTAMLVIKYSDGSQGTLGVGCHGPGAPDGIQEGVIATKGFVTYWTGEVPVANVDKNRTVFHVRR